MFKSYLREIHDNLGYLATWLPNAPLRLGAVGVIEGGRFKEVTSLEAQLGAQPPIEHGKPKGLLKCQSKNGITISSKVAGQALPSSPLKLEEAGLSVRFEREDSVVFVALDCAVDRFADVDKIGLEILQRVNPKKWKTDYVVVTEVVRAKSAAVLISNSRDAQFEVAAKPGVELSMISLAEVDVGLSVKVNRSVGIEIVAEKNLTPLFGAFRVKDSWLFEDEWVPVKGAPSSLEPLSVERLASLA